MTHKNCTKSLILIASLFASALTLSFPAWAEWNENVLYSFQGVPDGAVPAGGVVFDSEVNLYGATTEGGANNCSALADCGAVFQLRPPAQLGGSWTETVLYTFKGEQYKDGESPNGGLVIDGKGNLYGVTAYGGTGDCVLLGIKGGCGTVYELSPPKRSGGAWNETILYSFPSAKQGYVPNGNLVFDSAGNIYGATLFGGGKGAGLCDPFYQYCGTVFKLTRPKVPGGKWTERVLHSFAAGTDGVNPNGGLLLDSKGAIYGTTSLGGNQLCNYGKKPVGCGTVYKLLQVGGVWTEKILHRFTDENDGAGPGSLIFDAKGVLYGAANGGALRGGVVFRLATASGKETPVYDFSSRTYGFGPGVSLFDSTGKLCGTTYSYPDSGTGSVFCLKHSTSKDPVWAITFLYEFTGSPDGIGPYSDLARDAAGNLYGATQFGGTGTCGNGGCGMVFKLSP